MCDLDFEELQEENRKLKEYIKIIGLVDQYKASLAHVYHFAGNELLKCGRDRLLGSGLIIEIKDLSGKHKVMPFMVKDGLSKETINALLDDMQYSFSKEVEFQPTQKRL